MMNLTNRFPKVVYGCVCLVSAVALLAPAASHSSLNQVALGPNGEIYRAQVGTYGELFPGGQDSDPANVVLALDILRPGGSTDRLLVPGTEIDGLESSPSLVLEPNSQTLYIVWETTFILHSGIHLIGLRDSAWSETIEISGNAFSLKTGPHLAVTQDSVAVPDASGRLTSYKRTVLHTVWSEEVGEGHQVIYAPLVFIAGAYVGENPVYVLNRLDTGAVPAAGAPIPLDLVRSTAIYAGRDEQSVVAAMVRADSGELVTLEIRLLSGELSHLAEDIRAHIANWGLQVCARPSIVALAEETQAYVLETGTRFHSGVLIHVAEQIRAHIANWGIRACATEGLTALAERVGEQVVEVGGAMLGKGLKSLNGEAQGEIVEIGPALGLTQHLDMRIVSRCKAPTSDGVTTIFLSPDGQSALVAWEKGNQVLYSETRRDSWSPVLSLDLDAGLNREEAHRILKGRLNSR